MRFADPTGRMFGMDPILPLFQSLPFAESLFSDFFFAGITLLLYNGLTNLISFIMLIRRQKFAPLAGVICGK